MLATRTASLLAGLGALDGRVHVPGDAGYEAARLPWQRAVAHHPDVVVEAGSVADVRTAVLAARTAGAPFAVMGTGHGAVQGLAGGLLLRTGALHEVVVDPDTALVRVGAGTTWDEVLAATEPHGLAPGCGTSGSVGVTGYTLQGGVGWLSRQVGTAADDLVAADVVTARGELVTAAADQNADLLWALRGGGGGFGVVTALTLRVHPVGQVVGGSSYHPYERAADVLAAYRAWAPAEPDGMSTAVQLLRMPDRDELPAALRDRCVVAIRVFSTLGEGATRERLAPLLAAAGPPLVDDVTVSGFAPMLRRQGSPPPTACTERVHLCDELAEGLLEELVDAVGPGGDGVVSCVELKQWGGAIAAGAGSGPVGHRGAAYSVLVAARYGRPHADDSVTDSVADSVAGLVDRLAPYVTGGSLLSLLPDRTLTASAFTADDLRRLTAVKDRWDPDDLFGCGHTVPSTRSHDRD